MSKNNVVELSRRDGEIDSLTELVRTGAIKLIQQAVEAELAEFMTAYKDKRLEDGRAAVVRNGYQPEREIQTGIFPKCGPRRVRRSRSIRRWYRLMYVRLVR